MRPPYFFHSAFVDGLKHLPPGWVWPFARPYIAGPHLEDALHLTQALLAEGLRVTLDVLGEDIHQESQARQAAAMYHHLLQQLPPGEVNLSVKLSQLGLDVSRALCVEQLQTLLQAAGSRRCNTASGSCAVRIDMEASTHTDAILSIYRELRGQLAALQPALGIVLQAMLRRTQKDIRQLMEAGLAQVRLCKGAYLEPRSLAYTDPWLVRENYLACLELLLRAAVVQQGPPQPVYVAIATHDEWLVWHALRLIEQYQVPPTCYEFQMLLGVDTQLRGLIREAGHPLRVYVPFGVHWHAYAMRRFRENPQLLQTVMQATWKRLWQ
jgi:proline dehydrogenase